MYYQIEGRMNMKTLTFDEEGLTVGKQSYPIDDIENLKIASAPLFATYGILTFRSGGRDIYEEVKKLKELLDMGIVTEEELQKKKKELLQL